MGEYSQQQGFINHKTEKSVHKGRFIEGVKIATPTLLGYVSIGFASGVVGKTAGLSMIEIALMCLLIYSGTAQFIAIGMMVTKVSISGIIFTIFLINLRHILLSASLSPYFKHLHPVKNAFIASLLTDETYAVAMNEAMKKNHIREKWMYGLNIASYTTWFIANLVGAYFGQWIHHPEVFGLDFALSAMFIGLLILQIANRGKLLQDIIVAISAVVIVLGAQLVTTSSIGIILAVMIAAFIGVVLEK